MNPFSKNYVPQIKLTPDWRAIQLSNAPKAQREKIVLADSKNQIHITTQDESDESRRKAGRRLGV
jgi:hypothetical protein